MEPFDYYSNAAVPQKCLHIVSYRTYIWGKHRKNDPREECRRRASAGCKLGLLGGRGGAVWGAHATTIRVGL